MDAHKQNEVQFQFGIMDFVDNEPQNIITELHTIAQLQKSWVDDFQKMSEQGEKFNSHNQEIIRKITQYYKAIHNDYVMTQNELEKVKKSNEHKSQLLVTRENEVQSLQKIITESEERQKSLIAELKGKSEEEHKYIHHINNLTADNKAINEDRQKIQFRNDALAQKLKSLEDKNFQLQEKLLLLKIDLEKWTTQNTQIAELTEQNLNLRQLAKQQQQKLHTAAELLKKNEADAVSYKQAKRAEYAALHEAHSTLNEKLRILQSDLNTSRAHHAKMTEFISNLQTQKDTELEKIAAQLTEQKQKNVEYQNLLTEKSSDLKRTKETLQRTSTQVVSLQNELQLGNDDIAKLELEIEKRDFAYSSLEADIHSLKESISGLTSLNSKLKDETVDLRIQNAELSSVAAEFQIFRTHYEQKDKEFDRISNELVRINTDLNEKNLKNIEYQVQIAEQSVDLKNAKESLQNNLNQISEIQRELSLRNAEIAKLELEIDKNNLSYSHLEAEIASQNESLSQLASENTTLSNKIIDLQKRNSELVKIENDYQNIKTQYDHKDKEFDRISNELVRINTDLNEKNLKNIEYQVQIAEQSVDLKNAKESLQNNLNQISEIQRELSLRNAEIAKLELENKNRDFVHNKLENEISGLRNRISELSSIEIDYQHLISQNEQKDKELDKLNADFERINTDLKEQKQINTEYQTQLAEKSLDIESAKATLQSNLTQITHLQHEGSLRDIELGKLEIEIQKRDSAYDKLEAEYQNLKAHNEQKDKLANESIKKLESEAQTKNLEITNLKQKAIGLIDSTEKKEAQILLIKEQKEKLNTQLDSAQEIVNLRDKHIEQLTEKVNHLSDLLESEKAERNYINNKLMQLNELCQDQERQIVKMSQNQNEDRKQNDAFKASLDSREQQLTFYSQNINSAKRELKEQISRFEYELQLAKSLNPISDILKITEKEIDRFEQILKKTPTIASERQRLENVIDELFEQKRFLKASMGKVFNDIEHHQYRVRQMGQSSALKILPPPPPFDKDKAF